jgi:glucokinase
VHVKKDSIPVGRPAHLRHRNALTILRLLREAGSCSRADLVRASGLSAPTVTNVVGDLLAANLIRPLGEGESSGGRPPDMISFKSDRGCLLAAQIAANHLSFLLTDLSGTQLDTAEVSLAGHKTTPESICHLIGAESRLLLKKHKMTREQLLALVVAVPAIANVDEGLVISVSTLQNWRNVPLRGLLGKIFDCLVVIENDTNLAALGEHHRGAARFHDSFVLIMIGANVSAGIVLSGRIHHGAQWAAGEIGYLRLPHVARKHPALHEFGEVEHVLTGSAIVKSWLQASDASSKHARPDTVNSGTMNVDARTVLDLAQAGDSGAKKIVQHRAAIASDIIVNLSLILNPDLILLGGEIGSHPVMLSSVHKQLQRSEFAIPEIAAAALGHFAILLGAIALALEMIPSLLLPEPGN